MLRATRPVVGIFRLLRLHHFVIRLDPKPFTKRSIGQAILIHVLSGGRADKLARSWPVLSTRASFRGAKEQAPS